MAWPLTVGALALLLVPVPSRSCVLLYGLPKGTKTTGACKAAQTSQLEHGKTEHLPQPAVRPGDFIIENYGALDQRLTVNVTLVSSSLSDWIGEIINNDDVRVEIYYSTSENCDYVSCLDAHNNTCVVRRFKDIKGYLLIAVNVSDNKGNWKKHCLDKLQTLPRAKAAAVKDFKVMHVNSSTVKIKWHGTVLNEANHPVQYRVKLGAKNLNPQPEPVERIYYGTPPNKSQQHLITGLIPHGVYSAALTVQPITLDDVGTATGIPSDPVRSSVTMPEDVPARNPLWAPGKFSFDQCEDGGSDCKSTATIYWQPLEELFRNGIIHYIVTVKKISGTNLEELILRENVTETKTSYQIEDLHKGPAYRVELEAATVNGTNSSADPSVIYLDDNALASPRPSHVESIKAKDHRSILVTWRGAHGSNYSVVWCREGKNDQVGKCEGQVWSQAVGTQTSVKVRMALAEREERHRFGVWMNDGAAGIVWSSCLFQEGVPPKAVPPADIYSRTGHLVVKVKKYRCEDSAVPTSRLKYYVGYCLTKDNKTCSGEVSKESIGPDAINHQLVYPVEPNHFYKVTVYAEAEGGRSPKLVQNQFVPMSTKGGPVFGAVFGSLVAVLLITVIIVSLVVYWKHVKKHQVPMERPSTVKLIEHEDGDNQEEVFHEQDLMISTCRTESNNPTEECDTGEEELEQHLMARQVQPAEEAISEEFIVIDDYAKVTFTTEMMNARLLGWGDRSEKRVRPGEAVASRENETVDHFPEMVVHPDRTDDDMMSSRSSISNSLESARDLSGIGHCFEGIEVPKAEDTQMLEAGDHSDDEWSLLYDDVVTEEEETDSEDDGDSVVYPDGCSGAIFGGNNGIKSNEGHSNGPGVNSNESNSDFHSNGVNSNEIDSNLLSNGVPNGVNSNDIDSSLLSNGVPNDVNSSEIDSSLLTNGVNSSNDEDSGLHSNSMDSNENDSTEEDFDSIEDYSKFRPSTQTNGQPIVLCRLASSEDLDSASGEECFGWAHAGTHLANELVDDGIYESGRDGARMPVLPPLRDDFMIH